MVFQDVLRAGTISINLEVTNTTPYFTTDSGKNGVRNGLAYISVQGGRPLGLDFRFVSAITGELARVPEFRLSLFDLDMGPTLRETVVVDGLDDFYVTSSSSVDVSKVPDGSLRFSATEMSGYANNPGDPWFLDQEQADNCVGLVFKDLTNFTLTVDVNVTSGGFMALSSQGGEVAVAANLAGFPFSGWPSGWSARSLIFSAGSVIFDVGVSATPSSVTQESASVVQPPIVSAADAAKEAQLQDKEADHAYADGQGVKDAPRATKSGSASSSGTDSQSGTGGNEGSEGGQQMGIIAEPDAEQCASEWDDQSAGCAECTLSRTCVCPGGRARFGYAPQWTSYIRVGSSGEIDCSAATFGDPYPGQGKLCMCIPGSSSSSDGLVFVGALWWPPAMVALLFFSAHAVHFQVRTHSRNFGPGPTERALDVVLPVIRMSPMICVVFVAVASRANAVSKKDGGQGGSFFGRPDFDGIRATEAAISVCVWSLYAMVLLRYHSERDGTHTDQAGTEAPATKLCVAVYRVVAFIMYLLLILLVGRVFVMTAGSRVAEPPGPGLGCAAVLAFAYFITHFAMLLFSFEPPASAGEAYGMAVAKLTALNLNFAPMVAALLLALQAAADSVDSSPPASLRRLEFQVTAAALAQSFLAGVSPLLFEAELKPSGGRGQEECQDLVIHTEGQRISGVFLLLMNAIRWAVMGFLLLGMMELAWSLWWLQTDPAGMGRLICFLTVVYFGIYVSLWVVMTSANRKQPSQAQMEVVRSLARAKEAVDVVCPLLAILRVSWWVVGEAL